MVRASGKGRGSGWDQKRAEAGETTTQFISPSFTLHPPLSVPLPPSLILRPSLSVPHPPSLTLRPAPSVPHPPSLTLHPSPSVPHPPSLTLRSSPSVPDPPSPTLRPSTCRIGPHAYAYASPGPPLAGPQASPRRDQCRPRAETLPTPTRARRSDASAYDPADHHADAKPGGAGDREAEIAEIADDVYVGSAD